METFNTVSPVAQTTAGTWVQGTNDFLNNALNIWGRVEQIKAQKSASGADQIQAMVQPEIANGAGVQIDGDLKSPNEDGGFKVDKRLLMFSGSILLLAFALRKAGVA